MNLDGSLSIASGSLANISSQLGLVSNNIANASTPDYCVELPGQSSLVAGIQPMGVHTQPAIRAIDLGIQRAALQQDSAVSALTSTTTSLQTIDALQGSPGTGNDLGSLLGQVQSAFSTLLGDPSSAAQQSAVVFAARNLTGAINGLSNGYTQQRQAAQSDIVAAVATMNTNLSEVGSLSDQIIATRSAGRSSADLENQRDAAVHALSALVGIKTLSQPNGGMIVTTSTGTQLPTQANGPPVQTTSATVGAGASWISGAIPPIIAGGVDITNQLQGGRLGADIALRDNTLPLFQGELDEFSQSLAARFDNQGLSLFTDPNGNVPAAGSSPSQSGYIGFASAIQVNPAIIANASLVRDGTHDVDGSPTGASAFTANLAAGPAGFSTLINRVLDFAMGAQVQTGVAQPPGLTAGLGPDGILNAPYAAPATLGDNATALVSAQSAVSAAATSQLTIETTVQTTLNQNMSAVSGVNMDTEMANMIQLQNAYGANAKIITAVQAMFAQLLLAV